MCDKIDIDKINDISELPKVCILSDEDFLKILEKSGIDPSKGYHELLSCDVE